MAFVQEEAHIGSGPTGHIIPLVGGPYSFTKRAQVFTAGRNYILTRVALYLFASSYPNTCLFSLYSTSGGSPSSSLSSGTIAIIGGITYLILPTPVALTGGHQYALVTGIPDSGTSQSSYTTSVGGYLYGNPFRWDANGSSWVAGTTNFDMLFQTFSGSAAPSKPTNPTPTDTNTGIVLQPTLSWEAG